MYRHPPSAGSRFPHAGCARWLAIAPVLLLATPALAQPELSARGLIEQLKDRIQLRGRVFARLDYQRAQVNQGAGLVEQRGLTPSVPDARAALRARILDGVQLVLSADFAGSPDIKDAYLQAKDKRWLARVGRFKMPISAFTMESSWMLPLARRGWLEELLSDRMLLTGRREGVMGGIQGGGYWDPAAVLGVFQSVRWGKYEGDPMSMRGPGDATAVARLSVQPSGMEIGLAGQRRVTYAGSRGEGALAAFRERAFWAGVLDFTADFTFVRTGLRLWADLLAGNSWFDAAAPAAAVLLAESQAPDTNRFASGRALAAYRLGGLEPGALYLEAFATAGVLDPDLDIRSDLFFEAMAGLNAGHWRGTRLTVQVERGLAGHNFPRQFFLPFGNDVLDRYWALVFQAGAAF